jgi:hypothetical protein
MMPYGSAVVECRRDPTEHAAFVVSASDGVFARFDAGDDPVADLVRARRCAATLADTVFFSSSVADYWMIGPARQQGVFA